MPAIMTLGGIAVAVLGLVIAFAGLPDRSAGLGLGSDLIQAGASVFAGGLIIASLGQVLRALRDVADRVEEAGFGLSGPRTSLNDELADETPKPLPRAAARNAAPQPKDDEFAEDTAVPPTREPRTPRPAAREPQPQAAARAPRPSAAPQAQRPQPRTPLRPEAPAEPAQQEEDFADDFAPQGQQPAEPRWMRAQTDANRQQPAGVIPLQPSRQTRATPAAPQTPRRDAAPAPVQTAYEPELRRRPAPQAQPPQPEEIEHSEPSVVRSGIIAGMAYTLYSDGSIEAELPSGLVRFNSLSELQDHVKRAGAEDHDGDYRGPNAAQR